MKFLMVSPKNRTVYNFRGDLIKEIQKKGFEVVVTGPDMNDIEKIEELSVKFVEIPMNKTGTSLVNDLKYCIKLKRIIKAEKIDATLGYTVKPVVFGAIAARLAGVKNINSMVTGAGYLFVAKGFRVKILSYLVRIIYWFAFVCSKRVIFHNNDDKLEFCSKRLVKECKCSVVNGSGVDLQKFAPTAYPKTITFFMLARLLKSKGVLEYLQAAKNIKHRYPKIKFALLGSYDNTPDALSAELIEPYVEEGIIERYEESSDVRPYYINCSVYVLPSYREGVPRTILEAMAMARPIITTDTNGCRDTVIDGYNGILVPIKDAGALEEKMQYFIEHPDKIEEMGINSLTLCRQKFDVSKVNQNMLEIMGI